MPFINGRFYANPAYGRGLERAREQEAARNAGRDPGREGESPENQRVTPSAAPRAQEKPPTPQQVIDQVRNSEEYRALGRNQGTERAQKLFDALGQRYGNMGAVYYMARFAEGETSEKDFQGFRVGKNVGRSAARHFFLSAVITGETNSALGWAAGLGKEAYDLIGGEVPRKLFGERAFLPGAGHASREDLETNTAGRRFARDIHSRQHKLPFPQLDKAPVRLSDYTDF